MSVSAGCRKEYNKRINKVLEYIDSMYASKLSVGRLAEVAHFSPYHFHRVFHAVTGESINTCIKRIRLSKAAYHLLYSPGVSITEIAYDCGFSSHSDFSRCFKSMYGVSPSQFAAAKGQISDIQSVGNKSGQKKIEPAKRKAGKYLKSIRLATLPDLKVAYIRCTGLSKKLRSPSIEQAFRRLFLWGSARGLINMETRLLGITLDSPEIVPMKDCRYDACIAVPDSIEPEGEIGVRLVNSEGKYVVFEFVRNRPNADKVFFNIANYIYGHWMPENGYLPDDKPFIEIFGASAGSNDVLTRFHIPVKPF